MNTTYISSAEQMLRQLKNLRKEKLVLLDNLKRYENTRLKLSTGRKQSYYYARNAGSNSFSYLGNRNHPTVKAIKQQRFLSRLLDDVDSEITLLEQLLAGHREISYDAVNSRLPSLYRLDTSESLPVTPSAKAEAWLNSKMKEKLRYPTKYPERLIMRALDGTPMRSKSEVIIANMLISNGIHFVYELPHEINGATIYTDFTILSSIDYQTEIMIEHEGLMTNADYQHSFLFKVNNCLAADIIPGRDIFFTFDDLHGGFDPSVIQDIIDTKLKP